MKSVVKEKCNSQILNSNHQLIVNIHEASQDTLPFNGAKSQGEIEEQPHSYRVHGESIYQKMH